uniref:Uncharacterized protein n=1 Tax=Trichobilharzia regenti TaxID=157069 RepID=A0AA85KAI2_TRIRE
YPFLLLLSLKEGTSAKWLPEAFTSLRLFTSSIPAKDKAIVYNNNDVFHTNFKKNLHEIACPFLQARSSEI